MIHLCIFCLSISFWADQIIWSIYVYFIYQFPSGQGRSYGPSKYTLSTDFLMGRADQMAHLCILYPKISLLVEQIILSIYVYFIYWFPYEQIRSYGPSEYFLSIDLLIRKSRLYGPSMYTLSIHLLITRSYDPSMYLLSINFLLSRTDHMVHLCILYPSIFL